jgi:hypothetical protein
VSINLCTASASGGRDMNGLPPAAMGARADRKPIVCFRIQ